ncbi:MAG: hypothetical protein WCJ61_11385 [Paludibacter sp.]
MKTNSKNPYYNDKNIDNICHFVLCLGTIYLQRHRIKKFFYPKAKLQPIPPIYLDDDDVMGKTKTQLSQVATNDDTLSQIEKPIENAVTFVASKEDTRFATVENHELDSVFSGSPEPMDLDIECEYEESELLEEEDLNCFMGYETFEPARGIQYDEMENLVQVIQKTSISNEVELIAVNTIQQMDQTELFQSMIAQIDGGKERVAEMLDKYYLDASKTNSINSENLNVDFEQFEINNFM